MAAHPLYLPLTNVELELIDCKLAVVSVIKGEQRKRKLTTDKLAVLLGLSRASTASLLKCDVDITLDEVASAFFRLDKSRRDFGAAVQREVAVAWGVDESAAKTPRRRPVQRAATASQLNANAPKRRAA